MWPLGCRKRFRIKTGEYRENTGRIPGEYLKTFAKIDRRIRWNGQAHSPKWIGAFVKMDQRMHVARNNYTPGECMFDFTVKRTFCQKNMNHAQFHKKGNDLIFFDMTTIKKHGRGFYPAANVDVTPSVNCKLSNSYTTWLLHCCYQAHFVLASRACVLRTAEFFMNHFRNLIYNTQITTLHLGLP